MTRDEVIKILGEGATEEQIKGILDKFHEKDNDARANATELAKSKADLLKAQSELANVQSQLDDINRANMTAQEQIEADRKAAQENLANSKKIFAKAKAQEILASVGINDEELINSLVSDNVELTEKNANIYVNTIKTVQENAVKKTKEDLANLDLKPNPSNSSNEGMTWEKFQTLSDEEQNKFALENPTEFANL